MMKRLMANIAAFGMVGCIILVMAGCGGSDSTKRELADTKEQLAAAEAAKREAEAAAAAAETRATTAETRATAAETRATTAETAATAAQTRATAAETAATAAQTRATTAETAATAAEQQAQDQEANQRAERLKASFGDPRGARTTTTSPVTVESIRAGSLTLTHGGYSTATLSGNGIRSATMALTRGGDSGKTVVYTDRELTRSLLEHYGIHRDTLTGGDKARFNLAAPDPGPLVLAATDNLLESGMWKISHGRAASVQGEGFVAAQPTADPPVTGTPGTVPSIEDRPVNARPATASSYAGSLHGKSGRFVCVGDGCEITITPTYDAAELTTTNNLASLSGVTVAATGGTLYFKPSSPTLQLYDGGLVGADTEYMVFGYWREDPTSPAADYMVRAFANVVNTASRTEPGTFTATYDGTAVGMYVEQDPNNPVDTHRQGEFTADVHLEVDGAPTTIFGTIDDFQTTPTGGSAEPRTAERWVVRLMNAAASGRTDGVIDGATAYIDNLAGVKSGTWDSDFVPAHQHADTDLDTADAQRTPPAVTGTFDTRIVDFVHLIGAYGAEIR